MARWLLASVIVMCIVLHVQSHQPTAECPGERRPSRARETWFDMPQSYQVSGKSLKFVAKPGKTIPPWLGGGRLFRVVPAQFIIYNKSFTLPGGEPVPVDRLRHYFDGLAMIVKFSFTPSSSNSSEMAVQFSNRYLESNDFVTNNRLGSLNFVTFGTPAHAGLRPGGPVPLLKEDDMFLDKSVEDAMRDQDPCSKTYQWDKLHLVWSDGEESEESGNMISQDALVEKRWDKGGRIGRGFSDNTNVNIYFFGDQIAAATDTPQSIAFDEDTLDTIGYINFTTPGGRSDPAYTYGIPSCAHTLANTFESSPDPIGTLYNHVEYFGPVCKIYVMKMIPKGNIVERQVLGQHRVSCRQVSYMHSFALTENYIVLSMIPAWFEEGNLINFYPIAYGISFHPEENTTWLVFDRVSGEVAATFHSTGFFMLHHVNAYEDPTTEEIVVDVITYPDSDILDATYLKNLKQCPDRWCTSFERSQYSRYRLPMAQKDQGELIKPKSLSSARLELPQINPANRSRQYGTVFGIQTFSNTSDYADAIVKINSLTGESTTWHEDGCYPSEAIFVDDPSSNSEDAGILLSVVMDVEEGSSFLLILDAISMEEIGRAECPFGITQSVHGIYVN